MYIEELWVYLENELENKVKFSGESMTITSLLVSY